jgi:microcystin degradation protein MlrC
MKTHRLSYRESTINKVSALVGITPQKSALVRWKLTRHFLASFSSAMNDRAGITSTSKTSHEEMKQKAFYENSQTVLQREHY